MSVDPDALPDWAEYDFEGNTVYVKTAAQALEVTLYLPASSNAGVVVTDPVEERKLSAVCQLFGYKP